MDLEFDDKPINPVEDNLPPKERIKIFLAHRSVAYRQVFDPKSEATKEVLEDLSKFCRAEETTFHADPRIHAVLEGRREVWLRIHHQLTKSPDELCKLYERR